MERWEALNQNCLEGGEKWGHWQYIIYYSQDISLSADVRRIRIQMQMGDVSSHNKLLSDKASHQQKEKLHNWRLSPEWKLWHVISKVNVYSFS